MIVARAKRLSTQHSALSIFLILALITASLSCRRASGTAEDPFDRESLNNFVAYLRIDTSNPPGNETAGARFLQQLLAKEGIAAQLVGSDPKRQSVYARLHSGTNEKALLLLHHIDVVPVAASEWTTPPFGGTISGGYIWGRGALDIKSLGIAELMSVIDLKRRNAPLARDVIFLGVADEELGGLRGIKALLDSRPDLFANVGYVINEGGYTETIVDRVSFWGIEVQGKTPLWIRLHAKGQPGHAASPPDDGGAALKLVHALDAVARIPTPYRLTPEVEAAFHAIGAQRKGERADVLTNIANELASPRLEQALTPSYRALLRDTIAVTRLSAGVTVNAIPANATADVDIRLVPGEKGEPMLQRVRGAAGANAEVEVLLEGEPSPASSADTDLYRILERDMKDDEPGSSAAPIVGAGATDSRYFRARGIVAYGVSPFKVNSYDAVTAHANDERIRAAFFTEGVRLTRRIVSDFCERRR